jgi:hypothetical protein
MARYVEVFIMNIDNRIRFGSGIESNIKQLRISSQGSDPNKRQAEKSPTPSPYSPTRGMPSPPRDRSTSPGAWNLIRRGLSRVVSGPGAMDRILEAVNLQRQKDNIENPNYEPKRELNFEDIAKVLFEDKAITNQKVGFVPSEVELQKTSGYKSRSHSAKRPRGNLGEERGRTTDSKPATSSTSAAAQTIEVPTSSTQQARAISRSASRSPAPDGENLGKPLFKIPIKGDIKASVLRSERILFNFLNRHPDGIKNPEINTYLSARGIKADLSSIANTLSAKMDGVLPGARINKQHEWGSGAAYVYRKVIP